MNTHPVLEHGCAAWLRAAVLALAMAASTHGRAALAQSPPVLAPSATVILGEGPYPLQQQTYALAADVGRVATIGTRGILLWDGGGRLLAALEDGGNRRFEWYSAVAASAGGRHVAVGLRDGRIALWDRPSAGAAPRLLEGHGDRVTAIAFLGDSGVMTSGGGDGSLVFWVDGNPALALAGHDHAVTALALSADGRWLASGDDGGTVLVWEAGALRYRLQAHAEAVYALAFSPDARWLASGGRDARLLAWDMADGRALATIHDGAGAAPLARSPVYAVSVSPDGAWLAFGGMRGEIGLWEVATGRARAILLGRDQNGYPIAALGFSSDGTVLSAVSGEGTLRQWPVGRF
ncbi:MAG: WD40 repeat domain-containing protein [Alphaproteobacteria bacterium]